jgi:selenocysteine lyase/cysteine desulfurase
MTRRELGRLMMTGALTVVAADQTAMRRPAVARNAVERWRHDFPGLQDSTEDRRFVYLGLTSQAPTWPTPSTSTQQFEHGAYKFGAGTPNAAGAIATAAAADYLESLGRDAIRAHEEHLIGYALERLGYVPKLRLLGPRQAEDRIPVFSFDVAGIRAEELMRDLDARGVAIRAGDLSALPLLKHFGVSEAARASCYLYTTESDIDGFIQALHQSISRRSATTP